MPSHLSRTACAVTPNKNTLLVTRPPDPLTLFQAWPIPNLPCLHLPSEAETGPSSPLCSTTWAYLCHCLDLIVINYVCLWLLTPRQKGSSFSSYNQHLVLGTVATLRDKRAMDVKGVGRGIKQDPCSQDACNPVNDADASDYIQQFP